MGIEEQNSSNWWPEWLKPEWDVIKAAPRAFFITLSIATFFIAVASYWLFKENLTLKSDRISELTFTINGLREENKILHEENEQAKSLGRWLAKDPIPIIPDSAVERCLRGGSWCVG